MPPLRPKKYLSLDCETQGIDWFHGTMPFLVTTCQLDGTQLFWEWDVDPLTRKVSIPPDDVREIKALIDGCTCLIGHNSRFDAKGLHRLGIEWPWHKTHDTLMAGHLLNSSKPRDLTAMCLDYLSEDISPYEDALQDAVQKARRMARSKFKDWRIAKEGLPDMPSIKTSSKSEGKGVESGKAWRADYWLPRTIAKELEYPTDHPWWTVLSDYANTDSLYTLKLWMYIEEELKK